MPSNYNNVNQNPVFGADREGLILLKSGGQLELPRTADVQISEAGLLITNSADTRATLTFIPWDNVAWIRTHLTDLAWRRQMTTLARAEGDSKELKALAKELSKVEEDEDEDDE